MAGRHPKRPRASNTNDDRVIQSALTCSNISTTAQQETLTSNALSAEELSKLDIIALLKYKDSAKEEIIQMKFDAEMATRFDSLVLTLVSSTDKDTLVAIMREYNAGFSGYEALKVIFPTCDTTPGVDTAQYRRVFTLMTPRGRAEIFLDFFRLKGYERTQIDGITMELKAERYGIAALSCVNLRSSTPGIFIDVIESASHIACFPMFRMVATNLMLFISPSNVFAPYGRLSCENKAIVNSCHSEDKYGFSLPIHIMQDLGKLQHRCQVMLHRNPAVLPGNAHEGLCGTHPNCLLTLRSSQSEGCIFYSFKRNPTPDSSVPNFFHVDGLLWRLGGWGCYAKGPIGMRPYLAEIPSLHAFYEGQLAGQAAGIQHNKLAKGTIGW